MLLSKTFKSQMVKCQRRKRPLGLSLPTLSIPSDKEKEMGTRTVKCHTAVRSGIEDFPGGPGVKNLLAKAEHGFDPRSGKIPHAEWQ